MTPILASDTTAALAWPVAILLSIGLLGFGSIFAIARWGRRRWWGLLLAIVPTGIGGLCLILLLSEGALPVFYAVAAFPLLCGLCSLYFWSRKKKAHDEVA